MSIGKQFISALVASQSVAGMLEFGATDHLFRANEIDSWTFVKGFVKQYGKLPSPDTVEAHTGEEMVAHKEPAAYYFDLMGLRHTEFELKRAMKDATERLHPTNKDPEGALRIITAAAMALIGHKNGRQVADFREAYDLIMADFSSKWISPDTYGLQLGWPYLDKMTGGLVKGDLISIVGRPGSGKTFQMLYGAHHGWAAAGVNKPDTGQSRMFVSMEMSILAIEKRLAAMQMHMPMDQINKSKLSSKRLKQLKEGLVEVKGYGAPFYVVDGNLTATVEDICMMARQLKPDAIFVDGAYLVRHPRENDRYKRVAENCDLMKKELASLAPTVCSWQFAKSAAKKNKKKDEKPDLEDIGFTDAIAMNSSLVLGLIEEENVETLHQRKVSVLKGRNGETGEFTTRWKFDVMDFTEVPPSQIEALQYV